MLDCSRHGASVLCCTVKGVDVKEREDGIARIRALVEEVRELVGSQPAGAIPEISEATGWSAREVTRIMIEKNGKKQLTADDVRAAIHELRDGEVTGYGEIAAALGSPRGAQAVGSIVRRADVTPAEAARVIPTTKTRGAWFVMDLTGFESHADSHYDRRRALEEAGVQHRVEGNLVFVPVTVLVDRDELRKRLDGRD